MGHRMILHRADPAAASVAAISDRLAAAGVAILDTSDPIMLIEGNGAAVEGIVRDFPGWSVLPFQYHDAPKTREIP